MNIDTLLADLYADYHQTLREWHEADGERHSDRPPGDMEARSLLDVILALEAVREGRYRPGDWNRG